MPVPIYNKTEHFVNCPVCSYKLYDLGHHWICPQCAYVLSTRYSLEEWQKDSQSQVARAGFQTSDQAIDKFRADSPVQWTSDEIYAAVCVALTSQRIPAWKGDGTGMIVQMIEHQLKRARAAERELSVLRRLLIQGVQ